MVIYQVKPKYHTALMDIGRMFDEPIECVIPSEKPVSSQEAYLIFDHQDEALFLEYRKNETCLIQVNDQDLRKPVLAYARLLVRVLSQIKQVAFPKWGILGGIRPIKLFHQVLADYGIDQAVNYLQQTYLLSQQKIDLGMRIVQRQQPILDQLADSQGVYVHIPFCPSKCAYCSFLTYNVKKLQKKVYPYLDALGKELALFKDIKGKSNISCLYVGGGTPTSLDDEQFSCLLQMLDQRFALSSIEEVTVEAGRPDTLNQYKLQMMRSYGVNRISINPQTMQEKTLTRIGRKHSIQQFKDMVTLSQQLGFTHINADLILGLPGEDKADWRDSLEQMTRLGIDSITIHTLAYKKGAKLYEKEKSAIKLSTQMQDWMELGEKVLEEAGLSPYYLYRQKKMVGNLENTGFARDQGASYYNIMMMQDAHTIYGFGSASVSKIAHSNQKPSRYVNQRDVGRYMEQIDDIIQQKEAWLSNESKKTMV